MTHPPELQAKIDQMAADIAAAAGVPLAFFLERYEPVILDYHWNEAEGCAFVEITFKPKQQGVIS